VTSATLSLVSIISNSSERIFPTLTLPRHPYPSADRPLGGCPDALNRNFLPPEGSIVAATIEAAVNLLSVIFAQVYYPCHSNGLKEIAKHLGFRWSASSATGMLSQARGKEKEAICQEKR
jgi:hypothetical protein